MPKALTAKDANPRVEPYPKQEPKARHSANKENADAKPKSQHKLSKAAAEVQNQYKSYRDIPLEIRHGEVPCYDDATTVRRKLNNILNSKTNIPGTSKKWTQASISKEMEELERQDGAVFYNRNSNGPSARTLGTFLKKKGKMGGGDSPSYYWGYVLCEKLRIWEGGKKTKAREEAEKTIPNGHERSDPSTQRFWCGPNLPPPSLGDLVQRERSAGL
ncbi:MAG: hypothetical protein Q9170_002987 [Blastenia crenularia]